MILTFECLVFLEKLNPSKVSSETYICQFTLIIPVYSLTILAVNRKLLSFLADYYSCVSSVLLVTYGYMRKSKV
ncbi:hypothetical protein NOS3756_09710 [Nostoc sp. NIES-3756]|nr:hypothetical protein NOS3756_09710 [Nostoc sp. NIES-3756]BAY40257.1 hypothetical protein NIES2111_46400 [Nostoc sp. NIES-2111]